MKIYTPLQKSPATALLREAMETTPTGAVSAAEEAAMDRRRKLELWKAQKEAEKVKTQVPSPPNAHAHAT